MIRVAHMHFVGRHGNSLSSRLRLLCLSSRASCCTKQPSSMPRNLCEYQKAASSAPLSRTMATDASMLSPPPKTLADIRYHPNARANKLLKAAAENKFGNDDEEETMSRMELSREKKVAIFCAIVCANIAYFGYDVFFAEPKTKRLVEKGSELLTVEGWRKIFGNMFIDDSLAKPVSAVAWKLQRLLSENRDNEAVTELEAYFNATFAASEKKDDSKNVNDERAADKQMVREIQKSYGLEFAVALSIWILASGALYKWIVSGSKNLRSPLSLLLFVSMMIGMCYGESEVVKYGRWLYVMNVFGKRLPHDEQEVV